jgi:hypothetical protein
MCALCICLCVWLSSQELLELAGLKPLPKLTRSASKVVHSARYLVRTQRHTSQPYWDTPVLLFLFFIGVGCSIGVGGFLDWSALVWTCVFRPKPPATRSSQSQRLHPLRPSVGVSPGVHTHSLMSWCLRSALATGGVVKQLGAQDSHA